MCKSGRGGKLPRILIAENVELCGMAWYTVNIVVNDYQEFCGGKRHDIEE